MRVRAGWSGEMANGSWRKADVDCDETDLLRLAQECGFAAPALTNAQAYQLLEAEANRLLVSQLITRFGATFQTPEYLAEFASYNAARDSVVTIIRATQGLS